MRNIYSIYKEHYKALISLGLPIVIGQIGVIVLGFADTLMIGHHSTIELGAASFVNNVFNLVIIFSTGFSYGLTPIVGGLYGTHQYASAGQALRNSLLANLLVAFLLTIGMTVLYFNVGNLGQPEELIPLIKPYYLVLLASLVFVMLFNGFKQFTDGITDTKTAMWILLGGNVLNIIGNYILIYGKLGLPEMGLLGAGISTLFSRIMMVVVFIIVFMRSPRFLRFKLGFYRLGWSKAIFGRLNSLGWPIAFQMGMETASFSLSAVMIGWLGTIALGYFAVSFSLGIAARNAGLTPIQGFFASLFNNASAGEYAAFSLIAAGATYLEVAIITLIANARYLLMSCALAQKFAPGTPFFHRLIIGYDVTDELFGITIARPGYLNPFYTYGAIALAAPAWAMGTALGIIAGNLLPVRAVSALSVALYGMFLAIIIPPARKNRVVAVLVMLSFALSFACGCLPGIASLSDGTRTILLTVLISCGAAILFPVTPEASETAGTEEVQA